MAFNPMTPQYGQQQQQKPKKFGMAQGGLSPLLNDVMGTPEVKVQPMAQPIGGIENRQMPMLSNMGQRDAEQPTLGNMGQRDLQQPQGFPISTAQSFPGYRGPETEPTNRQPQGFPVGGQPQLIGNQQWQQALTELGQIKPFEPTAKLPSQEELGGFAKQKYEEQLGLISAPIQRRQGIERAQLAQTLADRGIPIGSEAYAREQYTLAERQAAENAQAQSQALQFGQQAAQQEYDRALAGGQFGLQQAQTASNLGMAKLGALSPLAQTQFGAGEQRYLQGQQLGESRRAQEFGAGEARYLQGQELAAAAQRQQTGITAEQQNLEKQIASTERLQGLSSQTQKDIASMEIAGKLDLTKLSIAGQNELLDKEIARDNNLAAFNRDTQLLLVQQQFQNDKAAREFDAVTKKELLGMQLDQDAKQFAASMAQDDKRLAQDGYQFLQSLNLNKDQFDKSYNLQLQAQADANKRWQKEFLQKVSQDKFLNNLQKQQLAELTRSNKADEAIKKYVADRAASGNRLSADEEGNIASSKANGALQGFTDYLNNQVAAGIITPKQRDQAVQTQLGLRGKGPGGVNIGVK